MKYYKRVLKNKLTIIEVPSTDAESVVVDFFVKTGSRSETAKENGISHFLEHFLFKGTKKYPSAMAITELVDGIGGEMNANTGKEHTQYFIKAHHSRLEMIFDILTDMIQNPLLDKPELEREKGVIVEEINMYKDSPRAVVSNLLEEIMWPKQALGRDIAGAPETVTKFT
ncbi:TPA: insulinase family protein, partial [Patescibacteria group bacterium]|nr:insulinase family protein [Patescibacteria group bacterium]